MRNFLFAWTEFMPMCSLNTSSGSSFNDDDDYDDDDYDDDDYDDDDYDDDPCADDDDDYDDEDDE